MKNIELFKKRTKDFVERFPELKYEWTSQDGGRIIGIEILKQDDNGFNVFWGSDGHELYYCAGDSHHSEISFDVLDLKSMFGFLRDLLSNKMRIIEKYSGKTTYKVIIQAWDGQQWVDEDVFGILFYNYLANKTEKIYQNNKLSNNNRIRQTLLVNWKEDKLSY